ncbi:MAG: hypothetical protein U0930_13465 [Pirellulales bacterium]
MANPCAFIEVQIQGLTATIQNISQIIPALPPSIQPVYQSILQALQAQLASSQAALQSCQLNPSAYSFQMDGIEITQSIQNMAHEVPLIAGKRTVVRVYLSNYNSASTQVRGELVAQQGSGPFVFVNSSNTVVLDPANVGNLAGMRRDAALSLNFELPSELTSAGEWTFSLRKLTDATTGNDLSLATSMAVTQRFSNAPPLRVRVIGIRYAMGTPSVQYVPSQTDFDNLFSWLRRSYPIAQLIGSQALIDINVATAIPFSSGDVNAQLAAIRALDVAAGADRRTHYYGMVSDGGFFMRGAAAGIPSSPDPSTVASGPTGSNSWGWDFDGSYGDWYGGHELGHTFGRLHPGFCGESSDDPSYPFSNGQLANDEHGFVGFDVGDPALGFPMTALPGTDWHDVMTYCARQWLSSYTYEGIRARIAAEDALPAGPASPGPASTAVATSFQCKLPIHASPTPTFHPTALGSTSPRRTTTTPSCGGPPDRRVQDGPKANPTDAPKQAPMISVVARVNPRTQQGSIRFVHPIEQGHQLTNVPDSPFVLRLRDANGSVLQDYPVPFKQDSDCDPEGDGGGLIDAIIPSMEGIQRIELLLHGKMLGEFSVGGTPKPIPKISTASAADAMSMSWEGEAELQDSGLSYVVQASTDDGASWFTVAVGLKTPKFTCTAKDFPGAKKVQLRLLSTNGLTQTVAAIQTLDIP